AEDKESAIKDLFTEVSPASKSSERGPSATLRARSMGETSKGSFLPKADFNEAPTSPITSEEAGKILGSEPVPGRDLIGAGWLFQDGKGIVIEEGQYHDDPVNGIADAGKVD